jgi:hypothetical protein
MMNTVINRTLLFAAVLTLSGSLLAGRTAPPSVLAVVPDSTFTQIHIFGSALSANSQKPVVTVNIVDNTNTLKTTNASVLTFTATDIVASLGISPLPGSYQVSVNNGSGSSNLFDFTIGAVGPQGPPGTFSLSSLTYVVSAPMNIPTNIDNTYNVTADCPSGSYPVGGGFEESGGFGEANVTVLQSTPYSANGVTGWKVVFENNSSPTPTQSKVDLFAYVICLAAS